MSTVVTIPTFADPFWIQVTAIDGVDYLLQFRYNQRENVFYLSISDAEGSEIVRGIKLVCNYPLISHTRDPRLPKGTLMVCTNTTDDSPPGLEDLLAGGRCELCYFPVA